MASGRNPNMFHALRCAHLRAVLLALLMAVPAATQSGWAEVVSPVNPSWNSSAVYDPVQQRLLAFYYTGTPEVWWLDGGTWVQIPQPGAPIVQGLGRCAYDPVRDVFVHAVTVAGSLFQTWEWNRTTWTLRNTTTVPLGMHDLAFHPPSGKVFGIAPGTAWPNHLRVHLYEWSGSAWLARSTAGGPTQGIELQLEWDAGRGELMVTYKRDTFEFETWYWDLTTWTRVPHPPLNEPFLSLGWDSTRGRMLGLVNSITKPVYEWGPAGWTLRPHGLIPPYGAGYGHQWLYVPTLDRHVLIQNQPFLAPRCGTWTYRYQEAVSPVYAEFGAGCAGSAGVPELVLLDGTTPTVGTTFTIGLRNLPPAAPLALLFIGFETASWQGMPLPWELSELGMPGCRLRLAPAFTMPLPIVGGAVRADCPLPANLDFLGGEFFHQALVLDFGAGNTAGAVVSNAIRGVIGS